MNDEPDTTHEAEYEDYRGPGRTIAVAAVVAIALGAAGYFAGHASAGGGPATLAEAVQQAQDGKLDCGDTGAAPAADAAPPADGAPPAGGGGFRANPAFLVRALCDGGQSGAGATAGRTGQGGRFGAGGFGGGVVGQVQSVDGSTLTIQGRQGPIKIKIGSGTTVRKSAEGSLSDVKPGDTVTVAGTGQDNATPATSITVLPSSQ